MTLTTVLNGQLSDAGQLNQIINALTGARNEALTLKHNSTVNYAVTIQGTGTGFGLGLRILGSTGGVLFSAQDSGLVLGSLASLAVTGALTAGTLGVTGTSTFTGQLGAGTIVATGPVSGTVLTASSSVNAATVTASGAISGTVLTASSSVNAATLSVTGTSLFVGAMTSSGGATFKAPVTMNTVSSATQLLTAIYGSTAGATNIVPVTSTVFPASAGVSNIRPSVQSYLTDVVGTGGHITAISGFTNVANSYSGGLPTAVAGDHHFGGVFISRGDGVDMRNNLLAPIDNSICGILAAGEVTGGAVYANVRGANIQARNTNSTAGTSMLGIEVNLQHYTGTATVDRFGVTFGSVSIDDAGAVGSPTGSNAVIGVVTKSTLAAPWQDVLLMYSGSGSQVALNSSGSIIRDASNSPMKYLADVSGSSFGVADAGLFNLPSNVTSTAVGAGGAGAIPPNNPEGYIKMRVNSSNVLVPFYRT